MSRVWYLPLEPLPQRYTEQMYGWVRDALEELDLQYFVVEGEDSYDKIQHGEWLDTNRSTIWKQQQITAMVKNIADGKVHRGDLILLGDVWMPGIETLKFQSDLLSLDLKIGGWHYAGCFDHFDYLARNLSCWGPKFELMLMEGVVDSVAFGSPFHRNFVQRHCRLPPHVFEKGLAWDHREVAKHKVKKPHGRKVIAYTHRVAPEKRPEEFFYLAWQNRGRLDVEFAISTNGEVSNDLVHHANTYACNVVKHESKAAYYAWLSQCTAVWSGADQETFGYSFMEAVALGVPVVAPIRACYPDHFQRCKLKPSRFLYGSDDPCGERMLRDAIAGSLPVLPIKVSKQYHGAHADYIKEFVGAYG